MSYSCTTKAMESFDQLIIQLKSAGQKIETNNGWEKKGIFYFHEIGREQKDGAITGTIYKHIIGSLSVNNFCRKTGTFRIEPDGKITRFPTSTKVQRNIAEIAAKAEIKKRGNIFSVI